MQPLFLEPAVEFEKLSAQTQLSEDPNAWPNELLQELYKQAPYIADFSPHVVMEKVDGEQGYGLGHVEIGNQTEIQTSASPSATAAAGVRKARIPVVIKDGMLSPFDLLVMDDSKVLPLTENRLRTAIFRPQAFDVTSRTPGDMSMIGQLYPPYRQSYGFGGSGVSMNVGMGKEGSALEQYLFTKTASHCEDCGKKSGESCSCKCETCKECPKEKTASFESEAAQFASPEYLHAPVGTKYARYGKKMEEGEYRPGMLDAFIEKNKTASAKSMVRGAVHAARNTASAKASAYRAGARAKNLVAKIKRASVIEAILPTLNESDLYAFKRAISAPELAPLLYKNAAAVTPSIQLLLGAPARPKLASHIDALIRPTVVQLKRVDEGYRLKTANHQLWAPLTQTIDRADAVRRFGDKVVLAADLSGAVTLSEGNLGDEHIGADETPAPAKPVTEPGLYNVQSSDGSEVTGYVIPNLLDTDGTPLPLALFLNGTHATVQSDIVGTPSVGEVPELPTGSAPQGQGVFVSPGELGVQATVPLTIKASVASSEEGEPDTMMATSLSGQDVQVALHPHLQTVLGTPDGKMLVPDQWVWVPLDQAESIALQGSEDGSTKTSAMRRGLVTVDIVSGGGGTYSLRGPLVEKLAHDEREMLGIDDAMFMLAALGVNQADGVKKLAQASTGFAPVPVRAGRVIKLAEDEMLAAHARAAEVLREFPHLRQNLFKEAAALGDPQAVDTVLSLGFLNPENLHTFVSYLPVLEDSQSKLCDILLASRLGTLIDTPDGAIERAVRSLEAVLEGLKGLAFTNN